MKTFFTLFLLGSSHIVLCQPTVTSGIYPLSGFPASMTQVDATLLSEGPSGASQTWTFTGSQVANAQINFVDPSATPYASSFPASNLAAVIQPGSVPSYNYFNHSSSITEYLGFGQNDPGFQTDVIINYTDPQTILTYPFTYNSQFNDAFMGSGSFVSQGSNFTSYRYGTVTVEADAYGTLTTPAGTFNNTLRLKIKQMTTDSLVASGIPVFVGYNNATIYSWISNTPGHVQLFQLEYDTISDNTGNNFTMKSAQYQSSFLVGIEDQVTEKESVNIYPNPAADFVYLNINPEPGDATVQIFDAMGKLVRNQIINDNGLIIIDTKEFEAGFYYLNIMQQDKLLKGKFIKQ